MNLQTDTKFSLRRQVNLSQYTTMQIGGMAEYFVEPASEDELIEAVDFARQSRMPWMVLGKGSNTVFSDEGFPGVIVSLLHYEPGQIRADLKHETVTASAGVHLYKLALAMRDAGLGGCEFLSGIPGTVGGAVMMNAGFSRFPGQTNEIGDLIEEVSVINPEGRKEVRRRLPVFASEAKQSVVAQLQIASSAPPPRNDGRVPELRFSYRTSNLEGCIVLEAKLKLWRRPSEEIEKEIRANFDYRNTKQDLKHPSSGSIFKNPPPPLPSAGRLIDGLGLKGTRIGGMMVSPRHGNYFIKVGPAKSSDLTQLIEKIQQAVLDATKVKLEPEVRIIGKP